MDESQRRNQPAGLAEMLRELGVSFVVVNTGPQTPEEASAFYAMTEEAEEIAERLERTDFAIGRLAVTHGVAQGVSVRFAATCLRRHADSDWGEFHDLCKNAKVMAAARECHIEPPPTSLRCTMREAGPCDWHVNEQAKGQGQRLLSTYRFPEGVPGRDDEALWIITEADRSMTTLLLPSEY